MANPLLMDLLAVALIHQEGEDVMSQTGLRRHHLLTPPHWERFLTYECLRHRGTLPTVQISGHSWVVWTSHLFQTAYCSFIEVEPGVRERAVVTPGYIQT